MHYLLRTDQTWNPKVFIVQALPSSDAERCVSMMSKSGYQFTVLYYKDVEVFEVLMTGTVFHRKSRGGKGVARKNRE